MLVVYLPVWFNYYIYNTYHIFYVFICQFHCHLVKLPACEALDPHIQKINHQTTISALKEQERTLIAEQEAFARERYN